MQSIGETMREIAPYMERYGIPLVAQHEIVDSSKLTCFMDCPRQYFFKYILGWRPEVPSNHLIFGHAWHKAMEILLAGGYDSRFVVLAYEAFEEEYRKTFGRETDDIYAPKTPERAALALEKYVATYWEDPLRDTVLQLEIGGTAPINEVDEIHFRMDSIIRNNERQKIFSREHKTGGSTYGWDKQWQLSMQVGTYTHVLYCLHAPEEVDGVEMNGTFFSKTKSITDKCISFLRIPAYRSLDMMNVWLFTADYTIQRMKEEMRLLGECCAGDSKDLLTAFPIQPGTCSKYLGCEYLDFCQFWRNPLLYAENPPPGFIIEHWDPKIQEARNVVKISADSLRA